MKNLPIATWSIFDQAWLAGYYEGEGSLVARQFERRYDASRYSDGRYTNVNILLSISSTDEWPLHHAQTIAGGVVRGPYKPRKEAHTKYWLWTVSNWQEVLLICTNIYSHLSPRRQAQLDKALTLQPEKPHGPRMPSGLICDQIAGKASQLGAQRHRALGEKPCAICQESARMWNKEYWHRRKDSGGKLRQGRTETETSVEAATDFAAYMRDWRARRKRN